ncbi:hypothetical protein DYB30_008098 [Aphanomyces astaci]|uniref:Uncharacterized protein n=1 Tax=Aphanomyces astaci TaxID=112090 RepID=A0A397E3X7_APHAT|nr:hypothetical protein DYB30_008098 [Aphanomyces astaci]
MAVCWWSTSAVTLMMLVFRLFKQGMSISAVAVEGSYPTHGLVKARRNPSKSVTDPNEHPMAEPAEMAHPAQPKRSLLGRGVLVDERRLADFTKNSCDYEKGKTAEGALQDSGRQSK